VAKSNRIDSTPFALDILDLAHDGRGVGRRDNDKAIFVSGALPGERVLVRQSARSRQFDEGIAIEVMRASPDRVLPRCAHFATCGGCALQHLDAPKQIAIKQKVLLDNLARIGRVTPDAVLPPLTDAFWGYRRKGRFSVRRVEKKGKTLVGFRERDPRFVADLTECHTIHPQIAACLPALSALLDGLSVRAEVPQIEFIAGERQGDFSGMALVLRHLKPLAPADVQALVEFVRERALALFLQPGGVESVHLVWPQLPAGRTLPLAFGLPQWNLQLAFAPLDFIQVNAGLNVKMIARTLELLDVQPGERILDLFCGLGNFTLPLARTAGRQGRVVGVEGDAGLVARARANALRNGLTNVQFHAADLAQNQRDAAWMREGFDKLLLDPPRSGALEVLKQLPLERFRRMVYVSCHPGSLARDVGYLVNERGWHLLSAGVMDMFPQTAHVESIALLVPGVAETTRTGVSSAADSELGAGVCGFS